MRLIKELQLNMIKEKNEVLEFNILGEKYFTPLSKLSGRKLYNLKTLTGADQLRYAFSLAGMKNVVKINRDFTDGYDTLANKSENKYRNMFLNRLDNTIFKKPRNSDFHFGIEVECYIPYSSLDSSPDRQDEEIECEVCDGRGTVTLTHRHSVQEQDVDCENCNGSGNVSNLDYDEDNEVDNSEALTTLSKYLRSRGIKGLHIQEDGSIDPEDSDYFGVEISCLTSDFRNLELLCKALNDLKAGVNSSCGLHVHLDMRNTINIEKVILENMQKSLDVLFKVVPASRRSSTYCKKQVSDNDKYSAFNAGPLGPYQTIECRLHSGSTDFKKIKSWCLVLKKIVDKKEYLEDEDLKTINQFAEYFELDEEQKTWLQARYEKFNAQEFLEKNSPELFEESEAS